MLTPFVVVGASVVLLLASGGGGGPVPRPALVVGVVAAVLYVHGHGAHLAANSIHNSGVENDTVYFWDERFSHIEAVLGWFGLVAAACLASRADLRMRPAVLAVGALLLGWTFFTSTVEGQTWWLQLAATAAFAVWAVRDRRPLVVASAGAFAVGAALIGTWALLQGGVPEFSDL